MKYFIILLMLSSCSSINKYILSIKLKTPQEVLEQAYQRNSIFLLDTFFNRWHEKIPPIDDMELLNQSLLVREVYKLVREIYNPYSKFYNYQSESLHNNTNIKYFILPNSISFMVLDTLSHESIIKYLDQFDRDRINNFRPVFNYQNVTPVYLSKKYKDIIDNFIIMDGFMAIHSRASFINQITQIVKAHWGVRYNLYTHPQILDIYFSSNLKFAQVNFSPDSGGKTCLYKKIENQWQFVELVGEFSE